MIRDGQDELERWFWTWTPNLPAGVHGIETQALLLFHYTALWNDVRPQFSTTNVGMKYGVTADDVSVCREREIPSLVGQAGLIGCFLWRRTWPG
jgi:hypothetical protein